MSICSSPLLRRTRQNITSYLSTSCIRFTFIQAQRPMTSLQSIRHIHTKRLNTPLIHNSRRTFIPLFQHNTRFIWSSVFRWRKPPEDDEAIRQREEEAARIAILEKAFESRQSGLEFKRHEWP